MNEDEISVKIGAQTGDLKAGMADAAESVQSSAARMATSFKTMASQTAESINKSVEKVTEGTHQIKERLESISTSMKKVHEGFILLSEVAFAGVIGEQLFEVFKQTAEVGDALLKTSQKAGVTVEYLSRLKYAASMADVAFHSLQTGLVRLSMNMNLANQGAVVQKSAFAALGIKVTDATGNLRNMDSILPQLADKFASSADGAAKTAMAVSLFGRTGAEMIPWLNEGSKGLQEMGDEAERLGLVWNKETAEGAQKLDDDLKRVKASMQGITMHIMQGLIPAVDSMAMAFSQSAAKGGVINEIITTFGAVLEGVVPIVKDLGKISKDFWRVSLDVYSAIGSAINATFGTSSAPMTALMFFKNVMKVIDVAVISLRVGFEVGFNSIKLVLAEFVNYAMEWAHVVVRLLHLDLSGAVAAVKKGTADAKAIFKANMADMVAIATKGKKDIDAAIMGDGAKAPSTKHLGGGSEGDGQMPTAQRAKKAPSRVSDWEVGLAKQKEALAEENAANDTFYEFSKQKEADYWHAILARHDLSKEERLSIEKQYYALKNGIQQAAFQANIAHLKTELDAYQHNQDARLAIALKAQAEIAQHYGTASKEYEAAAQAVLSIEKAKAAQLRSINAEIARSNVKVALSGIDAQEKASQQEVAMGQLTEQELLSRQLAYEEARQQITASALDAQIAIEKGNADRDPVAFKKLLDEKLAMEMDYTAKVQALHDKSAQASLKSWQGIMQPISSAFSTSINGMIQGTQTFKQAMSKISQSILAEFIKLGVKRVTNWVAGEAVKTTATVGGNAARQASDVAAAAMSTSISATAGAKNILMAAWETMANVYKSIAAIPYVGPFLAPAMAVGAFGVVAAFAGNLSSASGGYDIPAGVNPMTQLHQREMVLPQKQADVVRQLADGGGAAPTHIHARNDADVVKVGDLKKLLAQMNRNFVDVKV